MEAEAPFGQPTKASARTYRMWETIPVDEQIATELPWLVEADYSIKYVAVPQVREFISGSFNYPAPAFIFNQALNDWFCLMDEIQEGAGRPATRTARALVEHAINMADVATSPDRSKRYMDHLAVVAELQEKAKIGLTKLSSKQAQAVADKLEAELQIAEPQISQGVETHGKKWKSNWAGSTLFDRAKKLGLENFYNYYRIASLVMHGAAGGTLGTRATIDGNTVHRTGPALDLCPMAYFEGNRALISVLDSASRVRPDMDFSEFREKVEELLDSFEDVRNAFIKIDENAWPSDRPAEPHSVAAVARNGKVRWYWHEPGVGLLYEAEEPVLQAGVEHALEEFVADVIRFPDEYIEPNYRWVPAIFDPPALSPPKKGGRAVPSSSVLAADQISIGSQSEASSS